MRGRPAKPITEDTVWRGWGVPHRMRDYVFERDGYACQYCGATGPDVILEPDHLYPQGRGGITCPQNLTTACRPCNRRKGDRLLVCWL